MSRRSSRVVEQIIENIDIPDSVYETAERRYKDLGSWFCRDESTCAKFSPKISPQGSFRIGTVTRPIHKKFEYDLDLGCNLESGFSIDSYSQESLKTLIGVELARYRLARRIEEDLIEKHRCWRLQYADEINFHMDVVPCVPESPAQQAVLRESMITSGIHKSLAEKLANTTVHITDDRHVHYKEIATDWNISNPEGYAKWFEFRMNLATSLLEKRMLEAKNANVVDLPTFKWKTPLQRCIQILKRHRDIMFSSCPELSPISIIISTTAAQAYNGEIDLEEALRTCVFGMESQIRPVSPRVPNPVDPDEDFADKWNTSEGRRHRLEENFRRWLTQVKNDLEIFETSEDDNLITEHLQKRFGVAMNSARLHDGYGRPLILQKSTPKTHMISEAPARPWMS